MNRLSETVESADGAPQASHCSPFAGFSGERLRPQTGQVRCVARIRMPNLTLSIGRGNKSVGGALEFDRLLEHGLCQEELRWVIFDISI